MAADWPTIESLAHADREVGAILLTRDLDFADVRSYPGLRGVLRRPAPFQNSRERTDCSWLVSMIDEVQDVIADH